MRAFMGMVVLAGMSFTLYAADAGTQLVQRLNAIQTLTAHFIQVVNAKHKTLTQSEGHMLIQRPGHFRWETQKPTNQLLLADGQHVWIYDKELEQVTIKPQSKVVHGTPALFLSDSNDQLLEDFNVDMKKQADTETYHLQAKSNHPAFTRMDLSFKGSQLQTIALEDQLGQVTHLNLTQVKQNQAIPAKAFQFHPPRGVDVIRE